MTVNLEIIRTNSLTVTVPLFSNDPLWDGEQCEGTCCSGTKSPPWFNVQLPTQLEMKTLQYYWTLIFMCSRFSFVWTRADSINDVSHKSQVHLGKFAFLGVDCDARWLESFWNSCDSSIMLYLVFAIDEHIVCLSQTCRGRFIYPGNDAHSFHSVQFLNHFGMEW